MIYFLAGCSSLSLSTMVVSLSHYFSHFSLSLALSFYVFVGPVPGGASQSISKSDDARPARRRHRLLYLLLIILSALAFQSVPSLRRNRQPFTGTWSRSSQPGPPSGDRYLSRSRTVATVFLVVTLTMCRRV